MSSNTSVSSRITRRRVLQGAAQLAMAGALGVTTAAARAEETIVKNKRIKQSIVRWCFEKHWDIEQICRQAKRLGCLSVELVDPKDWPTLKKHGLICAIAGSHGFEKGMNNPKYQEMCIEKMRAAIDAFDDGEGRTLELVIQAAVVSLVAFTRRAPLFDVMDVGGFVHAEMMKHGRCCAMRRAATLFQAWRVARANTTWVW